MEVVLSNQLPTYLFCSLFFRSSLGSCILGLDVAERERKENAKKMFFPIFSALLDALLLRAQVSLHCNLWLLYLFFYFQYGWWDKRGKLSKSRYFSISSMVDGIREETEQITSSKRREIFLRCSWCIARVLRVLLILCHDLLHLNVF